MNEEEEEEDDDHQHEITTKLRLVLAAKSRKLQYTSSPLHVRHVSLFSTSSSVPFSWEEEPGKPKHNHLLLSPNHCLDLPPRLLFPPPELTRIPLSSPNHCHRGLVGFRKWFKWRKERVGYVDDDDDVVAGNGCFVFSPENGRDIKITRRRVHNSCLLDLTRCYFSVLPWKNKKLKNKVFEDVL